MSGTTSSRAASPIGEAAQAEARTTAGAREERFELFGSGEKVGRLTATGDGTSIVVDYEANHHGRGGTHREEITVGADGRPLSWHIEGVSAMGGAVEETLRVEDGDLVWASQADEGRAPLEGGRLYVANDASPYKFGVYARAALAAGGSLQALPDGTLRVDEFRRLELDLDGRSVTVDAYALSGVELLPEFVLLDEDRRLVARLGGYASLREVMVREELAGGHRSLGRLDRELTRDLLRRVQERIAHRFEQPVRIRNVRVFDPHSLGLTEPVDVIAFRGRITGIEPSGAETSGSAIEVDGAGGTLVAGLHDMHAHNTPWTGLFYLAAGITTARDMGNDNELLLDLMPRFDAGELPGPCVVPSGFIDGPGPHSAKVGVVAETLDDAISAVHWYAERGYHQVKLYDSIDPAWVKPIVAEAQRLGLPTVGHVPTLATPDRVIEDGYREITHINQLMLAWQRDPGEETRRLGLRALALPESLDLDAPRVQRTVELMQRHDVGLDTTIVILERLMLSRARHVQPGDAGYLDHVPIGYRRYRKRTYAPTQDEAELRTYEAAFRKMLATMDMLCQAGVRLWPGTDDGTGFTLHRELELYVDSGMQPAEVLRLATLDCAAHLGRGQTHGSVERGKAADLILLDGDPTRDIGAVRRIRMVMKGGDVYFPAEIYKELGIEPFALPPAPFDGLDSS